MKNVNHVTMCYKIIKQFIKCKNCYIIKNIKHKMWKCYKNTNLKYIKCEMCVLK